MMIAAETLMLEGRTAELRSVPGTDMSVALTTTGCSDIVTTELIHSPIAVFAPREHMPVADRTAYELMHLYRNTEKIVKVRDHPSGSQDHKYASVELLRVSHRRGHKA